MKHFGKITLSILLCFLLLTATILTGCQQETPDGGADTAEQEAPSESNGGNNGGGSGDQKPSDTDNSNNNETNGGETAPAEVTLDNGLVLTLKNGTYEVTGYTGTATTVTIPDSYADESVISIGVDAFTDCSSLTSITIPNSVTRICKSAFSLQQRFDLSVTFANPNGWTAGSTSLTVTDLSNPATAVTYLKSTYCNRTWTRTDATQ